jgi:hypothetical protein
LQKHEQATKIATSLKSQFDNWILILPVLSLKGAKYDIDPRKEYLHKLLRR